MNVRSSRPVGVATVAAGLAAALGALAIGGWGGDDWGARTVPLIAALTLVTSGVAILAPARSSPARSFPPARPAVSSVGAPAGSPPVPAGDADADDAPAFAPAMLLALGILYVLAIDRIGYLASTALVAPLAFVLFGERRPLVLALAATLVPLALHVVFFRLLGVFPPFGRWFDVLDVVPL